MKIRTIKREYEFIPAANGNKDLPDAEQVKVKIKSFPTASEASDYRNFYFGQDGAVKISYNDSMMMIKHVEKIENLETDNGPITTGSALAKAENNSVLSDIIGEIRDHLLEDGEDLTEGES